MTKSRSEEVMLMLFNGGWNGPQWFPDLTLVSKEGRNFQVHSRVLRAQSTFFAELLEVPNTTLELDVSNDTPCAVVEHLYGLEVTLRDPYANLLADDAVNYLEAAEKFALAEFPAEVEKAVCKVLGKMSPDNLLSFGVYLYEARYDTRVTQAILDYLFRLTV
ncbi:Putative BTB/POZ domain-containing protein [Septoria linicola]|uniref:BTB/POZ domain-containing protein n=1 Tax=Septoria linicola TaxID=215465 RepID=A0A9Q9B3Q3_9PEZI|nr:Putative BTB/POZ domain-containing protein [Septoria linicola]